MRLRSTLSHARRRRRVSQTPGYPTGDGDCAAPACDVGPVPVGEYLFDWRAWNVSVHGQSLLQWFIEDYVFNAAGGGSPLVSGFFFDDMWTLSPSEMDSNALKDMGLSLEIAAEITASYWYAQQEVAAAVLARGKFSWQLFYTGQWQAWCGLPECIAGTCPVPLVQPATCAANLESLCAADAPPQRRALMYAFSPGNCAPQDLTFLAADIANFLLGACVAACKYTYVCAFICGRRLCVPLCSVDALLLSDASAVFRHVLFCVEFVPRNSLIRRAVRGPYAWLGHGWEGCDRVYPRPADLDVDYGVPLGICGETSPGSGVFVREWSRATVQMNCSSFTPTIITYKL